MLEWVELLLVEEIWVTKQKITESCIIQLSIQICCLNQKKRGPCWTLTTLHSGDMRLLLLILLHQAPNITGDIPPEILNSITDTRQGLNQALHCIGMVHCNLDQSQYHRDLNREDICPLIPIINENPRH